MASLQKEETTQAVETTPLVTFQYRDVWFPSFMDEQKVKSDLVGDFSWRQSDVVVIGYPKSGSTWVSNILQNIQDFGLVSRGNRKQARASNVKIIYVTRNPKDVCVSLYHFNKKIQHGKMALEWNKTVEEFTKGRIPFNRSMVATCHSMEDNLSDQDIQRIKMACSVEGMRESIHKYVIHDGEFFGKGIVGDWKNHFPVAQNEMFDKEIVSRLEEAGIPMKYELP
ncbi:sulfotransferase 1B1-like [Glandiceps talaboti]